MNKENQNLKEDIREIKEELKDSSEKNERIKKNARSALHYVEDTRKRLAIIITTGMIIGIICGILLIIPNGTMNIIGF